MLKKWMLMCIIVGLLAQFDMASADNGNDDYNEGYLDNAQLPIWSHLTKFERQTLAELNHAREGNADALLMLYLTASGDSRSMQQYKKILSTINHFVETVSPSLLEESSEWRKGQILLQSMHKYFFLPGKTKANINKGYDYDQSQLSEIFHSKKYNCISSSLLYVVLARKFDMNVEGVLLPSHAFVQLELSNGKIIEIETTTAKGYDWVHDQDFYDKEKSQWFQQRGLEPSNFEDYKSRTIVSPVELGIDNMNHQHVNSDRMNELDRHRLIELQSSLSPNNINARQARLYFYNNEFVRLNRRDNFMQLKKMYRQISPFIHYMENIPSKEPDTIRMLAWIASQRAFVNYKTNDLKSAVDVAIDTLNKLDSSNSDRIKITENLFVTLNRVSQEYTNRQNFEKSLAVYQHRLSQCVDDGNCRVAIRYLYSKWASKYWKQKNWRKVTEKYRQYLLFKTDDADDDSVKDNLQRAYLNWENQYLNSGEWLEARRVLRDCIAKGDFVDQCQSRLSELKQRHRLD